MLSQSPTKCSIQNIEKNCRTKSSRSIYNYSRTVLVRVRMRVHKSTCARRKHKDAPKKRMKNEWNKWKNHFYEMKGDVGMSLHEKKGTRRCLHQDTKSLITPSLHLCFFQDYNVHFHAGNWMSRCCAVCFA